jgi:hypothetical protein
MSETTILTPEQVASYWDAETDVQVGHIIDSHEALRAERDAALETIDTLRRWMGEYQDDKYTGRWWLQELQRILKAEGLEP